MTDDIRKLLGKRIREIRKSKNLTQEALAEKVGIETRNILKIENGQSYPRSETLSKISNVLNVELRSLFTFEHFKDLKFIKKELVQMINNDDELLKLLYKIAKSIKE